MVIAPLSPRTFVERLDFLTTTGGRTTHVITDLGVLELLDSELILTALYPGVAVEHVRAQTGWDLRVRPRLATIDSPTVGKRPGSDLRRSSS